MRNQGRLSTIHEHFVGFFHEKAGRVKRKVEQVHRDGFLVSSIEKSARFALKIPRTQNGASPTNGRRKCWSR
jgi:hypothetical protein